MSKRNSALLILLLLQLLVIGYVYRPGKNAAPPENIFFPGITADQVSRLEMTDDKKNTLALAKSDSGWLISSRGDIPADPEKVNAALKKLVGLKSDRLVTRTTSSHQRFKVGTEYRQKVSLALPENRVASLLLGTEPSHKSIHVRAENDPSVYLVTGLSSWELSTDPASWWQTLYVDIAREKIEALTITNANGTISLTQNNEGKWAVTGQPDYGLDHDAVQALVDKVRRLSISEYLGKEAQGTYGLAKPAATLLLKTAAETVEVAVGLTEAETATQVIKSSNSPFYVRTGQYSIEPLLTSKLVDLQKKKENHQEGNTAEKR